MNRFVLLFACLCSLLPFREGYTQNGPTPPSDPEIERQSFVLPEGFEVNLFAADPQIAKPIQINFDPQGRLWIASSSTYPQIEPGEQADDKILYLQDTDGDGVSDKTQVFTGGLLIPTAVMPGDDGVYVGASTELLHLKDTDGDGQADEKRIVLSGFGTEDTHHIIHTLGYGPDCHLYFNQSIYIHSHIETPWGVRRLNAGGIWRFRPETLELGVLAKGLINPWGTDFDRFGQTFATDGAGGEGINHIVPGAYYATAYGAKRILHGLNPGSPKHCGLEIVQSPHLPEDWQGSFITNDFRGHRVCRFVLTEDGSSYRSQEQQEVIKSDFPAFRPIDVKQGPDGAIYIADWYNPIIQHGEVDFRDPRRDHTHGRIWRVTYTGKPTLKAVDFTTLSNQELLARVDSNNEYDRQQAKLVLHARGEEVLPEVLEWTANNPTGPKNLEGLWIHQSFGQLNQNLLDKCLASEDHNIRAAATRVIAQLIKQVKNPLVLLEKCVTDPHPLVRLEAVRALSEVKKPQAMRLALTAFNSDMDENIEYALWLTAQDLEPIWLSALEKNQFDLSDLPQGLPFLLRATNSAAGLTSLIDKLKDGSLAGSALADSLAVVADLGNRDHLSVVFDEALNADQPVERRHALIHTLYAAATNRKLTPKRDLGKMQEVLNSEESAIRSIVVQTLGAWKFAPALDEIISQISRDDHPIQERVLAVHALGQFSDDTAAKELTTIATSQDAMAIRRAAIAELLRFRPQHGAQLTAEFLTSASAAHVEPLFQIVMSRKNASDLLASALEGKTVPKDVAVIGARVLASSGQQETELAKILRKSGNLIQEPIKLSPAEMTTLVAEISEQGDPARGEKVFRRADLNCLKCHAIGPAGGEIGSNLLSLGATAQPDYIVESILDPNAKIKEGFHTLVVATDEGQILSGIKLRETSDTLFLRDAEGRELAIPKDSIEAQKQGTSLMPVGVTSNMTHQELIDLVSFLSALGREPAFTVGTAKVFRHWETIESTKEAAYQFRRKSYADAASENPEYQWQRVYSQVDGSLPLSDLPEIHVRNRVAGGNRGMSFVRTRFEVLDSGPVSLELNDATGLQIWLDGNPVEADRVLRFDGSPGVHQLTMAIDRGIRKAPIRLIESNSSESSGKSNLALPTGK